MNGSLTALAVAPQAGEPPALPPSSGAPPGWSPDLLLAEAEQDARDRVLRRRAILVAASVHVALLFVVLPERPPREIRFAGVERPVFVVQNVRFRSPPPKAGAPKLERRTRKIPIPDPTPDDPEPILELDAPIVPTLDELHIDVGELVGIPDGPPGHGPLNPIPIAGSVVPPRKIFAPQPLYTEAARQARIEGVVVLQTVIDTDGQVDRVELLKGLPHGLAESAVETVKAWRFEPAMLDGEPVAVYLVVTVSFSMY